MITVTLTNQNVNTVIDIVRALREDGLTQGTDFNFKWHPAIDSWVNGTKESSYAEFYFYKDEYATMFTLRYV